MNLYRSLGAAAVLALAAPAVAAAHPTVYTSQARTFTNGTVNPVTRYVVVNHGFTVVLSEDNGLAGAQGVVGFNLVPGGAYRAGLNTQQILDQGGSGAQAHATCLGGAADLGDVAQVAAWQGGVQTAPTTQQPFWNYVPFQTTSAGLDDDPDQWTPTLVAAGFNLADLADEAGARAACEGQGGTYRKPDSTTTTAALTLRPSRAIARALKGAVKVSAEATSGDRIASASGKLAR